MPITTPNFGWRIPLIGEPANTPLVVGNLGGDIDTDLAAILARLPVASYAVNTNIVITTANTATSLAIPFPAGRFTVAPVVVVSTYAHAGGGISGVGVTGISTTGCTLWVTRNITGSVGMYCIAQQQV